MDFFWSNRKRWSDVLSGKRLTRKKPVNRSRPELQRCVILFVLWFRFKGLLKFCLRYSNKLCCQSDSGILNCSLQLLDAGELEVRFGSEFINHYINQCKNKEGANHHDCNQVTG